MRKFLYFLAMEYRHKSLVQHLLNQQNFFFRNVRILQVSYKFITEKKKKGTLHNRNPLDI